MKEPAVRAAVADAAFAWVESGDPAHLEQITALVRKFNQRKSRDYFVATHAVRQYMLRSGCKSASKAKASLLSMLDKSEEMDVKDRYKAIQLINHHFKDARYFKYGMWLMVTVGNTIVTCHQAEAKRWKKLSTPTAPPSASPDGGLSSGLPLSSDPHKTASDAAACPSGHSLPPQAPSLAPSGDQAAS